MDGGGSSPGHTRLLFQSGMPRSEPVRFCQDTGVFSPVFVYIFQVRRSPISGGSTCQISAIQPSDALWTKSLENARNEWFALFDAAPVGFVIIDRLNTIDGATRQLNVF